MKYLKTYETIYKNGVLYVPEYVVLKKYYNTPINPDYFSSGSKAEEALDNFVRTTPAEIVDISNVTDKYGKKHKLTLVKFEDTEKKLPREYALYFKQWYRENISMDSTRRYLWVSDGNIAFKGSKEDCEFYIEAEKYNL